MRKQVTLKFEAGDANYVKPGERFIELTSDGKGIASISKRADDLTLSTEVSTPTPPTPSEIDTYLQAHQVYYEIVGDIVYQTVEALNELNIKDVEPGDEGVYFDYGRTVAFYALKIHFYEGDIFEYEDSLDGIKYTCVAKADFTVTTTGDELSWIEVSTSKFTITSEPIE